MEQSSWDFDAPQFVDFSKPHYGDDNADRWFEFDHENGIPANFIHDEAESDVGCHDESNPLQETDCSHIDHTPDCSGRRSIYNTRSASASRTNREASGSLNNDVFTTPSQTPHISHTTKYNPTPKTCDVPGNSQHEEGTEDDQQKENQTKTPSRFRVPSNLANSLSAFNKKIRSKLSGKSPMRLKALKKNAQKHAEKSSKKQNSSLKVQVAAAPEPNVKRRKLRSSNESSAVKTNSSSSEPRKQKRGISTPQNYQHNMAKPLSARKREHSVDKVDVKPTTTRLTRSSSHRSTSPKQQRNRVDAGPTQAKMPKIMQPLSSVGIPGSKKDQLKSTEELELERMRQLRQQVAEKRKQNEKTLKMAQASVGVGPLRSVSQPTVPVEFHFKSDERLKYPQPVQGHDEKDFVSQLRKHPPSPSSVKQKNSSSGSLNNSGASQWKKRITIPRPFNLTENRKRKASDGVGDEPIQEKYTSVAEKINRFQKGTPVRFHSKSNVDMHKGPSPAKKKFSPQLTMPKTPHLQARTRSRPITAMSQQEKEDLEAEELKKAQFKAQPLNEKILVEPPHLPQVAQKGTTKPVGFQLATDQRKDVWESKPKTQEPHYEFRARPVPETILKSQVGIPEPEIKPCTIPESPAFALKHRIRIPLPEKIDNLQVIEEKIIKAKPVPHTGIPFQPCLTHKATSLHPFTFDQSDKERFMKKEEKIKQIIEENTKSHNFRATPLPSPTQQPLPPKQSKSATKPEPFHLQTDERGSMQTEKWNQQLEEEFQKQRQMAEFKAQPCQVTKHVPFEPKRLHRVLTECSDFRLNTEVRAHQRDEFEQHKKQKEQQLFAIEEARKQQQAEEERQAIKQLREEMMSKANPIRHYRPVPVRPSERDLTDPHTPALSTRLRCRPRI